MWPRGRGDTFGAVGDHGGGYRPYEPAGGGPRVPAGAPPSPRIVVARRMTIPRILVILVLCAVGTCALGGAIFAGVMWMSADMREVTHQFLGHVRARRYDAAYAMTSGRLRASVSAEAFPSWIDRRAPAVHTTTGQSVSGFGGGGDEECIDVSLTGDSWLFQPKVYVLLLKEGGKWRVDGVETTEPALCPD